jgi:WD40 repeat protein
MFRRESHRLAELPGEGRLIAVAALPGDAADRGRTLPQQTAGKLDTRAYDVLPGACARVLEGHRGWVWSIASVSLAGRAMALSGGDDATLRLWDVETGACARVLQGHQGPVLSIAGVSLAGRAMALSGGEDGTLRLWDLQGQRQGIFVHATQSFIEIETDPEDARRIVKLKRHSATAWRDWRMGADGAIGSWPLEDFSRGAP